MISTLNSHYYLYFTDRHRKPRQKCVALGTGKKSVALKLKARLEDEYALGTFDPWAPKVEIAQPTVEEAAALFLQSRKELRPKSQTAYRTATKGLLARVPPGLLVSHLEARNIRPYVFDPKVRAETQRHRFRHVRVFIRWCKKMGYLDQDPLREIKMPKAGQSLAAFLSPGEVERMLAAIDADAVMKRAEGTARPGEIIWLKNVVILAVNTGMRRGELCHLRWEAVGFHLREECERLPDQVRPRAGDPDDGRRTVATCLPP